MNIILLAATSVAFSFGNVTVECPKPAGWTITLVREAQSDGGEIAHIVCSSPKAVKPPRFTISTVFPQIGIADKWTINTANCRLGPDWSGGDASDVAHGMPLAVGFNGNDQAEFSVAASECVRPVSVKMGVVEEGDLINCSVTYFDGVSEPLSHYETAVRFNARRRPFAQTVRTETEWMTRAAGIVTCHAPSAAFDPLYSSWYGFHQNVFDSDIEAECAIAASLGMKTLIIDDGWQTDDTNRGYAFCGDWQVSKRRFPDMAAHVKRVQDMGLKYMLWYSVPLVGLKSTNYKRFAGKYLYELTGLEAAVLDPRFPEVRAFLIGIYTKALSEWNLDGFKLDFIDSFAIKGKDPAEAENYAGRDIKSVPLAVDRLMTDIHAALSAIKPDILIEFRQSYDGPAIRRFGNMIRVGDCPGDMRRNRYAIANLRLACGNAAVHADMLEWNLKDNPDKAALYIINSIFGVVQYSVVLREASEAHRAMIAKWIKFSQDHRETLLHGTFTPHHPELDYPFIEAESARERVIGVYDDGRLIEIPDDAKPTFLMNATGRDCLTIRRGTVVQEVACKSGDWVRLKAAAERTAASEPVKIIFDTDMLTDFDDVGALACLHALADAGECEILATVTCTRGNASVGAVEIINNYYGRGDLPVGCAKQVGVLGASVHAKAKIDPKSLPDRKSDGGHYKYRKLCADYPQWVRHADSDDAPDANEVYRKALAAAPDKSVVICSVGFLTNLRRLLETTGDAHSPLDGKALVVRKVKKWVAMACNYPDGAEYNSRWDAESSRIVLENWPTPVVFSDFQYGADLFAGRTIAEMKGPRNPVKDVFAGNIPSREEVRADSAKWRRSHYGMGGRAAWDETAVLAAVRGETSYFNIHRGTYRMVGDGGDNEWSPDEENGLHIRMTEKLDKQSVGRIIDELICRKPLNRQ